MLSGIGIGGGSILILYLTFMKSIPQLSAQSINLVYFLCSSILPILSFIKNKLIRVDIFIKTTISGVLACILSSFVASNIETTLLKKGFGILLIYIGITLVFAKKREA